VYRTIQLVLVGLFVVVVGLSALSRRFPHLAWLQVFRYAPARLSDEAKARMRRQSNILAGIEFILLGIALPMLYVASTVMFFNSFTPTATALVVVGSCLCIGLGITAIRRSRRG
jgi:hypothetical protein